MKKKHLLPTLTLIMLTCQLMSCSPTQKQEVQPKTLTNSHNINIWPTLTLDVKKSENIENKITQLLNKMTIAQKVAQTIQPEIRDFTVEDMRHYGFGSYLNGGGSFPNGNKHASVDDWVQLAEKMYQASIDDSEDGIAIPTMWGTDAVHGHNNVIGATLYPHNIGLGATRNPALIQQIASATAQEVAATGIDWVFAPTVAVVRDDRWGRTYEGYSENPALVKQYSAAFVKGLQGVADQDFLTQSHVIATVKHFLGDGGTELGDDQGDNLASEQVLFDIHGQGYVSGISAGAQTVMASFNSWHGKKNHGNHYLLTDVLKDKMGFDGLVVGDWNGHGQVAGCTNKHCVQAFNAGVDIFMVPTDWKALYNNTIADVKSGKISMARLDDAVARILRVKFRAGLFDKPSPKQRKFSGNASLIGAKQHRELARKAVRQSLVLLKNNDQLLPLNPKKHLLIAGTGADNIEQQSGGWSITWQGTDNNNHDFPGATSIADGIQQKVNAAGGSVEISETGQYTNKPDVAIVVFGEQPYAEGNGDLDNLTFQRGHKTDLALLQRLKKQNIPVVSVFLTGRPLWINAELNASDAFVVAWLPGTEGAGIADVILSKPDGSIDYNFSGKLSFSWPATPYQTTVNINDDEYHPLLPYGYGLTYGQKSTLSNQLPTTVKEPEHKSKTVKIFMGNLTPPWKFYLFDSQDRTIIDSNMGHNTVVNYRTSDKVIQEDARTLQFNGTGLGRVAIQQNFPQDFRGLLNNNLSLVFDIKVDAMPTQAVTLAMTCEKDCDASIDLTEQLRKQPINQWQRYSIKLACFKQKGANFSKIISPFSIETAGNATLSLANVAITPQNNNAQSVTCQ